MWQHQLANKLTCDIWDICFVQVIKQECVREYTFWKVLHNTEVDIPLEWAHSLCVCVFLCLHSRNLLSSLPPSVFQLPLLRVLIVSNNKLSSLPASIHSLTHLRQLVRYSHLHAHTRACTCTLLSLIYTTFRFSNLVSLSNSRFLWWLRLKSHIPRVSCFHSRTFISLSVIVKSLVSVLKSEFKAWGLYLYLCCNKTGQCSWFTVFSLCLSISGCELQWAAVFACRARSAGVSEGLKPEEEPAHHTAWRYVVSPPSPEQSHSDQLGSLMNPANTRNRCYVFFAHELILLSFSDLFDDGADISPTS